MLMTCGMNCPRSWRAIFHVILPKINNEMIVRHKPTPTVVNSRKKLLLGIIERSGQENAGI